MRVAVGAGTFWTEVTAWVIGSIDSQTFVDDVEASWPRARGTGTAGPSAAGAEQASPPT